MPDDDDVQTEQCHGELAGQPHGPHRWHVMEDTRRDCPGLNPARTVAADQPRDPLLTPEQTGEPQVDVRLFRLRDCAASTQYRAVGARPFMDPAGIRDAAAELAQLVRELDAHLTAGGSLPMEWRPELTSAEPDDFHWLLGELRTWAREVTVMELTEDLPHLTALLDRLEVWAAEPVSCADNPRHELALRAAFQAGVRRGIYESVREGIDRWSEDVPLDEDRYVSTAMEMGPPHPVEFVEPEPVLTANAGLCAPIEYVQESGWRPSGHETTFPCQVHLRVTYRDGTDAYYPVPADEGWSVNTTRREVVIGKGLGRIHVPLDVVWSYSPEECHPGRGRIQEHDQGPTARSER